jgi:surface protein
MDMVGMFYYCSSLTSLPLLDTSYAAYMNQMFRVCYSIVAIPLLDARNANLNEITKGCYSLTYVNIKNIKKSIDLGNSSLLSKESLLYLINNEAATSAITITLAPYAYERLANDADVVEALNNHPNISLASA